MKYVYLATFIGGILLAVRLLFFGAERRRHVEVFPLRRSEPAIVGWLVTLGITGYLLEHRPSASLGIRALIAAAAATACSIVVTRLAIATARVKPAHDPDDPRYVHQGQVGVVIAAISVSADGVIRYSTDHGDVDITARDIDSGAIDAGDEVCIDRIENGVAFVERWQLVEARL